MIANISALLAVCQRRGIAYETIPFASNLVSVYLPQGKYLFANATVPINDHAITRACVNKFYTYALLADTVRMPKTRAFLRQDHRDIRPGEIGQEFVVPTVQTIEQTFAYPVIVKPIRGTGGKAVYLAADRPALLQYIPAIFNRGSKTVLAQEYIRARAEYRAIFLGGEHLFSYRKEVSSAQFQGNLSPLHWAGARAVLVEDESLLQQIRAFLEPVFQVLAIPFVGIDIVQDEDGHFWLLELNSAPGFDSFVRDCGSTHVEQLYEKILCDFLGCEDEI